MTDPSRGLTSGLTRRFLVWTAAALVAGAALRLWMLHAFFEVNGDSLVYGGIAKNLLLHGRYALTTATGITYGTLLRLPGYPLFLALCFRIFGVENYFAVGCVQILLELAGCLLLAAFARQIAGQIRPQIPELALRAGMATLWLSALCPFTASYSFRATAEALTLFAIALAMFALRRFWAKPGWGMAFVFTFAVTFATLLRPDGALVAIAFAPAMALALLRQRRPTVNRLRMAVVCVLLALLPFAIWGVRNWKVFHIFQPLAPRLAVDPDESTNPGWERWVKTWCLDFVSTYEIYWSVPGGDLDVSALPKRAFDSSAQYQETLNLARDYNTQGKRLTRDIDARFAHLADERNRSHPWRYVWLPIGRMIDMWVRPRTENLPVNLNWWDFARHRGETVLACAYIALNAAYLLLGIAGLSQRPQFWRTLLAYIVLRCCLLLTVQAPEARYTLECFPMLFVLGGVALAHCTRKASEQS